MSSFYSLSMYLPGVTQITIFFVWFGQWLIVLYFLRRLWTYKNVTKHVNVFWSQMTYVLFNVNKIFAVIFKAKMLNLKLKYIHNRNDAMFWKSCMRRSPIYCTPFHAPISLHIYTWYVQSEPDYLTIHVLDSNSFVRAYHSSIYIMHYVKISSINMYIR